ncbi:MAG: DUF748 domain-containing protein [Nitrospirae bacterium]|nr:DUF748 domain-containing protein [Nitrospirota bacterium]
MKFQFNFKTALKALTAFIVVVSIAGFFIAPPIIKSLIVSKASEQLHRQVSVQSVSMNPFALSLTIKGFKINEPDGSAAFVSLDRLYINLESISLVKMGLVLREIIIEKPFVNIVRKDEHLYNFSDLIKPKEKKEEKPSDFKFSLNNIRIVGGKIDFTDTPKNKNHKISDMNISVPFVSNLPYSIETFVEPSFEAKVNNYNVAFKGKTKPFSNSLETIMDINLKGLDIPYYLAYSPEKLKFSIPSGLFDLNMNVSYVQHKDKQPTLTLKGNAALSRFVLNDAKQAKLLELPLLEVALAPSDVMAKQFHIEKIFIDALDLNVLKDSDGKINFASLAPKKDGKSDEKKVKAEDKDAKPLQLEIDNFQIAKSKVRFSDNSNEKPFQTSIEPIDLTVKNFSNAKGKSGGLEFSMQTEAKETVKVSGAFGLEPLISEGVVEIKKLQPKKYAAYYDKKLNFTVEQGELNASVKYKFEKGDKEPQVIIFPATFNLNS